MASEPTTIASVGQVIDEVLRTHYRIDPAPLFAEAGLDRELLTHPNARYPRERIMKLWDLAVEATGDSGIGLQVGLNVRTTSFHALGFSWLASDNLLDAFHRLARYYRVIATVPLRVEIEESPKSVNLEVVYPDRRYPAPPIALDSFMASIIRLCRLATTETFCPTRAYLVIEGSKTPESYEAAYGCPVVFGAGKNAFDFDREQVLAPLPGDNLELARANDIVIERYLEVLDPNKIQTEVKKLLIELLPTGDASQELIADRLNRSLSTLQRQLSREGSTFREIQEDLRKELAEDYIRDGSYSLSEIAYLLGFSDQSNFSRAFRRWHGAAPSKYIASLGKNMN